MTNNSSTNSSYQKSQKLEISSTLKAKIKKVDNIGRVVIEFSNPIVVPTDYASFDSSILNIKITNDQG